MQWWPVPTARGLGFVVAGIGTMLAAWALGLQDLVWLAVFLVVLPLVSALGGLLARPRLLVERTPEPAVAEVGEQVSVGVRVTAQRASLSPRVAARDDPGPAFGAPHRFTVATARRGQQTAASYRVTPRRRGRHTLDGFEYAHTDPLGFTARTARVAAPTPLVVTPRLIELPPTTASAFGLAGETPIPQTTVSGPDDVMVREYQPMDDVRRIHWPSTARADELMVRREEAVWDPSAWVLLDSRGSVHPEARGERPSLELLVDAAASIGARLLADGYTVTLVDAEGRVDQVQALHPGAVAEWIDPLIDVDVTGEPDLRAAAGHLSRGGGDNLVVALLGALDPPAVELLEGVSGQRTERRAFVVAGAPEDGARRDTLTRLLDRGWDVREVAELADVATAWPRAAFGLGVRP